MLGGIEESFMLPHSITLDQKTGGLTLSAGENHIVLHPLWIRERVSGDGFFDPISRQRLYEHAEFSDTLRVTNIISQSDTAVSYTHLTLPTKRIV